MNVTGTGIAVALAVVIAMTLLFFGPAIFSPFNHSGAALTATTTDMTISSTTPDASAGGAPSPAPAAQSAQPLPTTLTATDAVVGTGAEAKAGDTISVLYTGMLPDGTVFDASAKHGNTPFSFTLGGGQVIKGWDQGLIGMKVGGKRQLVIPPDMGYGAAGAGKVIPPNATLIFQVELLKIGT